MANPVPPRSRGLRTLIWVVALLVVLAIAFAWWRTTRHEQTAHDRAAAADATSHPGQSPASSSSGRTSAAPRSEFVAALEAARALHDPRDRSREFGQVLQRWLAQDPEAALAYVRTLPRSAPEFTQGLLATLAALGRRDPDRALRVAAELATTSDQLSFYSAFFAGLAERDSAAAAQKLDAVPGGLAKENAIRAIGSAWARRDFAAAFAWANQLPGDERSPAVESALAELAATDASRAVQLAQGSLQGPALERTLTTALHQLLKTDANAAAAVVPLLPAGEAQRLAAAEVAQTLAARDPAAALSWASQLSTDNPARTLAIVRALDTWAAADPAAAGRYVSNLPEATQRTVAPSVGAALADSDPQRAIGWAETLSDAQTRATTLSRVVDAWARHDPEAASRWVAGAPAGQLGGEETAALDGALAYWVLRDPKAPRDFVAALPAERQPAAARAIAPLLAQNNPSEAVNWALSLSLPAARDAAVAAAYQRWADNAPAEARAWLQNAPLAPEVKARLVKP